MDRNAAERLLAAHAEARDDLLRHFVDEVRAANAAVWQIGSFATGEADTWSDLDLVVSGGLGPVGDPDLVLDNPANGPAGGGYTGAAYMAGPLLVWVDWYLWPEDLPVPAEAKPLAGDGHRGGLSLSDALDRHGRGQAHAQSDPDMFALAMIPIAAKFLARGRLEASAGMVAMLGGDPSSEPVTALQSLLHGIDGPAPLVERVARIIDVAQAVSR